METQWSPTHPRVALYSQSTPKRRCMDGSRDRAPSQPITPQLPRSSYESQYNQMGFYAANATPHSGPLHSGDGLSLNGSPTHIGSPMPIGSPIPIEAESVTNPSPLPPLKPPDPVVDSVTHEYQAARVFRTRTALQLQPYTRERQVYEAVLRKGGLKKVPAPPPAEASSGEDFATPPDRVLVSPKQRVYRLVDVTEEDRSEYFIRNNATPTSDTDRELQRIARERLKEEKVHRRKQREEARAQKEFARLLDNDVSIPKVLLILGT
jgi:hypothetical protein